jgi:hypothetical protein
MKRIRKRDPEWGRAWYKKNREKLLARAKIYNDNNKDKLHAYYKANYEKRKNTLFKRKYGITHQEYIAMNTAQGEVCAICKSPCTCGRSLAVDHDHGTGKVRGLLCSRCNRGIGLFMESATHLAAAIDYLVKNGASDKYADQFHTGSEKTMPYFSLAESG